jgi:AraC-like DNA-binding protein
VRNRAHDRENLETLTNHAKDQSAPIRLWTDGVDGIGARMVSRSFGAVRLYDVRTSNAVVVRPTTSDDPDSLEVALQVRGTSVMSQGNQQTRLRPGDFALCDRARPCQISGTSGCTRIVIFSRDALRLSPAQLAKLTGRPISGQDGMGALVSQYLASLGQLPHTGVCASWHVSEATLDLLKASFCEQLECVGAQDIADGKASLLLQIRAYIRDRLGDPQLDIPSIATAHHISTRLLQKLFEGQGQTVSYWIRSQRLEYCRSDLANPTLAEQPVSSIAARWGLVDPAHFSRLFKSTYGLSPRAYRDENTNFVAPSRSAMPTFGFCH